MMSNDLVDRLSLELSPQLLGYLAKTVGENPANIARAAEVAIPALTTGIAAAARSRAGMAAIARLVSDPVNDGMLRNQLPALYQGTMTAAPIYRLGSQLMHQVFGAKLATLNQSIATLSGIKPASAATLTSTLAPHVLATIGDLLRTADETGGTSLGRLLGVAPVAAAIGSEDKRVGESGNLPSVPENTAEGNSIDDSELNDRAIYGVDEPYISVRASVIKSRASEFMTYLPLIMVVGAGAMAVSAMVLEPDAKPTFDHPAGLRTPPASATNAPSSPTAVAMTGSLGAIAAGVFKQPKMGTFAGGPDTGRGSPETVTAPPGSTQQPADSPRPIARAETAGASTIGTTTYFGSTPSFGDRPAVMNPGYAAAVTSGEGPSPAGPVGAPAVAKATGPTVVDQPSSPSPPPAGTTSYYGQDQAAVDKPVYINPDYTPGPSVTSSGSVLPAEPSSGTTSFFGTDPPSADKSAVINPDYKIAEPAPAQAPVASASDTPPATGTAPPPGTTTYFGISATRPDSPVMFNPDYQQSLAAPAEPAPEPSATAKPPAPAVEAAQAPTPSPESATAPTGVTTYFGSLSQPPDLPVVVNPDYRPPPSSSALTAAPSGPAAREPATTSTLADCKAAIDTASASGVVRFEAGQARLTAPSLTTLNKIAEAFGKCPTGRMKIEGHTDDRGNAEYNLRLSEARAQAVAAYLARRGADRTRITAEGFGYLKPLVPNSTPENRALNRRIGFVIE